MSDSTLRVGVAMRTVNVPPGTAMAGFAARMGPSVGVHDPLSIRALAMGTAVLIVIDCCALHEDTCHLIRGAVAEAVPESHVVVAATHTHSGPCIACGRLGPDQPNLTYGVMVTARDAAVDAINHRVPCSIGYGEARGVGVARDRRHLERSIDPPVQTLSFTDMDGKRRATFVSYPCHPVVLNAANRLISADFIYPLREAMEAAYPGSVCVYATGAAGDINTGHTATASFKADSTHGRDMATARRIGERIAQAAAAAVRTSIPSHSIVFSEKPVTLKFEDVDIDRIHHTAAEWARERRCAPADRRALLDSWISWAKHLDPSGPKSWTGRVTCLRIGSAVLVMLPGEPFISAATQLQAAYHDDHVIVLGYTDGVPGYFPAAAAYAEGGYEVADAHRYYDMPGPFAQGSLEQLLKCAEGLIKVAR